jgi:hypothetical protein
VENLSPIVGGCRGKQAAKKIERRLKRAINRAYRYLNLGAPDFGKRQP